VKGASADADRVKSLLPNSIEVRWSNYPIPHMISLQASRTLGAFGKYLVGVGHISLLSLVFQGRTYEIRYDVRYRSRVVYKISPFVGIFLGVKANTP
jgi:hypothetical protein